MKIINALILFLVISNSAFCQKGNYVIISIIKSNNSKLDGYGTTQWIINEDSLKESEFNYRNIIPLFIMDYSYNLISDCKDKLPVDPFVLTSNSNFSFPDSISANINQMVQLISSNKKLIQKIKKKWSNGFKEKVKIYATPVTGDFCNCKFINYSNVEFDPSQEIFIGFNNILIRKQFWNSINAKELKRIDFSIKYNFQRMWQ